MIHGGFSAVSEAIALHKPAFVILFPGHAGQYFNADLVRDLGFGYVVTTDTVIAKLQQLCQLDRWEEMLPEHQAIGLDGAREAADTGRVRGGRST